MTCELCPSPADPGDVFCVPCRIEVTAASQVVSDPVERLLSTHQRLMTPAFVMCLCGEMFDGPAYYRRHVAELILDALGLPAPVPWTPASDGLGL